MKNYTLREIQDLSKKFNYKYISLLDQNNKIIIPQNRLNKVDEKYKEIFDYLETPDISNIYFLSGKNSILKNVAGENYLINLTNNAPKEIIRNNPINLSSDFTQVANHPAVKMQQEINRLMLECERKDEIIENLENELDELIKLKSEVTLSEQEQPKSNFENAQQFLSQIMEFGAPLLDQHFQIKKDAIEIEKLKYANFNQQRQQARPQQARPQPTQDPVQNYSAEIKKIEDWIDSKKDTENFEKLLGMYHNSNTLPQFRDLLQQNDLELLNELDEL
jgi:hypothetical protein